MSEIKCCDCERLRKVCENPKNCVAHQYSGFKCLTGGIKKRKVKIHSHKLNSGKRGKT